MSQIGFDTNVTSAIDRGQPSRMGEMASEDFIRIIFTELTNQDPLQPNDTSALLNQLNSIRSIESDLKLTKSFEALVQENQLASASNLIGNFIGGLTDSAQRVAGYVVSAIRQGDSVFLELDNGWLVNMSNVETVIDPALFDDPPPNNGGNPPNGSNGTVPEPPIADDDVANPTPPLGSNDDSVPSSDVPLTSPG